MKKIDLQANRIMKNNIRPHHLISIITPSYNQGRFIEETIKSVLSQEGDFYIDYIIMDGGSTDNSIEIVRRYDRLLRDGEWPVKCRGIDFRWVSKKDRGQSDAIAKGFGMSNGEILAWLNSDDTYLPGVVKRAADFFHTHLDVKMLYGKCYFIDYKGSVVGEYPTEPFDYKRLATSNFICQPATFFRKDVLYTVGGLDLTLQYSMDYDLWIRIVSRFEVKYLSEYLAMYRLHKESKTVAEASALKRNEECLKTIIKHYGWAPANRVYAYHCMRIISKMPLYLRRFKPFIMILAIIVSLKEYIQLNKGIRLYDIRLLSPIYIKKIFTGWESESIIRRNEGRGRES